MTILHVRTLASSALLAGALLLGGTDRSSHAPAITLPTALHHHTDCPAHDHGPSLTPATGCCSCGAVADVATLTAAAERVVLGRVTHVESAWHDQRRLILTHATVQVEATLKGAATETVVVSSLGGTVGDTALIATGERALPLGAHVALFLETTPGLGVLRTCHAGQGAMSIVASDGGELIVPALPQATASLARSDARGAVTRDAFAAEVDRVVVAGAARATEVRR